MLNLADNARLYSKNNYTTNSISKFQLLHIHLSVAHTINIFPTPWMERRSETKCSQIYQPAVLFKKPIHYPPRSFTVCCYRALIYLKLIFFGIVWGRSQITIIFKNICLFSKVCLFVYFSNLCTQSFGAWTHNPENESCMCY